MKKIIKLRKKDQSNNNIEIISGDQNKYINMLYLNQSFKEDKMVIKNLKRKLNGYKSQDVKKNRYDKDKFISYENLIEKIVISKLLCHYCRENCNLIAKKKRDEKQWTLDRINNDIGHFGDNVVISCLKCNLQKRRRSDEHFKFAKQMRIIKHF